MAGTTGASATMHKATTNAELSITTVASAATKVCSTPELLEIIFSYNPVLDLVTATGVCKIFREVIRALPRLQTQLSMLPSKEKKEYWQLVLHKANPDRSAHLYRWKSLSHAGGDTLLERVVPHRWDRAHPGYSLQVISFCPMMVPPPEKADRDLFPGQSLSDSGL
jgi:hypothetical protein